MNYTPQELLRDAADALDEHPAEQTFDFFHPQDAWGVAANALETVTGMRTREYLRNRRQG